MIIVSKLLPGVLEMMHPKLRHLDYAVEDTECPTTEEPLGTTVLLARKEHAEWIAQKIEEARLVSQTRRKIDGCLETQCSFTTYVERKGEKDVGGQELQAYPCETPAVASRLKDGAQFCLEHFLIACKS